MIGCVGMVCVYLVVKAAGQRMRKGREAGERGMQLVAVVGHECQKGWCRRWCRSWLSPHYNNPHPIRRKEGTKKKCATKKGLGVYLGHGE